MTITSKTSIFQTFRYDENCRDCGTDYLTQITKTITTQKSNYGATIYELTTEEITQATVNSNGEIGEIEKTTTHTIMNNTGTRVVIDGGSQKKSFNQTSYEFQDALNAASQVKKSTGKSSLQLMAEANKKQQTVEGWIGGITGVVGLAISFVPAPQAKAAGQVLIWSGRVLGGVGVYTWLNGFAIGTDPSKMKIEIIFKK